MTKILQIHSNVWSSAVEILFLLMIIDIINLSLSYAYYLQFKYMLYLQGFKNLAGIITHISHQNSSIINLYFILQIDSCLSRNVKINALLFHQ